MENLQPTGDLLLKLYPLMSIRLLLETNLSWKSTNYFNELNYSNETYINKYRPLSRRAGKIDA